jgi:hypothetical protein
MGQSKDHLIGELWFRTKDGNNAIVHVYRGKGTFTLKRMMQDGTMEERSKIDVYGDDLKDYISEATLVWSDLERDGVELKPKW